MELEFGGQPIRFLNINNVRVYDSEDKEIEIPKCKECDAFMTCLIGLTHYTYVCNCGYQCEPKKH
jgi:hypothetical protein